ncbi:hypothetical protein V9K67_23125 [Paraflavisolibacter sp. H34]|uniref:hypothetical protein n=1 Tax=Huijunlia imazamoxiresistens TaxID=3127457 RepID=UPI0030193011
MRRNTFLPTAFLPGLIMTCIALSCSKDKQDSSLCGGKSESIGFWLRTSNSLFQNFNALPTTYMEGNNRVFQWSRKVGGVCPHEHVKVECDVELNNAASPVSARGRVDWLLFFERKITMTRSGNYFKGAEEVGLKQAFGEDTAWFVPSVEIFFPTKGSYSADSAFVLEHVAKVSFRADFRVYKGL